MKYQNELYAWTGFFHGNNELKEKMLHYLGEGKKMVHNGGQISDFYTYDHLIKAMTLFFKDSFVQENLAQMCLQIWNTSSGEYPEIEFETSYEKDKYYTIHFNYNRGNAIILPVSISIVSENHLGDVIQ